jgi:hypothetical protein
MKKKLLSMLVLLAAVATGAMAQTTYKVTLQEGTEDAENWSVPAEAAEGATVTATYTGKLKVKSVKAVKKGGALATPLTIEAITAGTISVSSPKEGMQYSKNGGAKTAVTTSIDVAAGDKVAFYGNGTNITNYEGTRILGNGDGFTCKVYGNIMSLVDETGFATAKTLSANPTFYRLFAQNTMLTDASGLLLPATELASYCYSQMFRDCTSLTAAPELPATELASNCYRSMFMGCTALTTAPVLLATTLVEYCYYQMFTNCSKLATVTCLAESGIDVSSSTYNWLNGAGTDVQGTKTVYTVSTANWPEGNNSGIPTGWTRMPPTLASVFDDGATVLVKANTKSGDPNLWFGVTGTYNESTSEYATTSCGSGSLYTPKTVSMTKDGNNLVVFMESNYNQITITFNTTNNTYRAISTSSPAPVAINTFITLIVNGVDITSTLTAVPSETITLTGGSDMGENTYSGTHFQVTGEGDSSITVNKWKNMVISAKTGKTIVDVVFSYAVDMNLDALTFSSGTFDGSNMVENVNATSLTVGSTSPAGTRFNGVTIYYSE